MNEFSWKAHILMNKFTTMRPSRIPRLSRSGKIAEVTYVSRHVVLCGGSKPRWGLEVATQAVNRRLHAWQKADEENYKRSLESIGEHMQEFQICMIEYERIDLALKKLANFEEAELRGSTKHDCNLEEELRQVEASADQVMTKQEALFEVSHFAEAYANELLRVDADDVEHAVDESVIKQDKVEPADNAVAVILQEEATEAIETTPCEGLGNCLHLNDDKVFDGITLTMNVNETLESAHEEEKLSGVDSKTTQCLGEKLQGKLLHYRELKHDLVVILNWYKKQIEAAQDYLEDSWGDAYRKVIVDIKWLRKEVRKLRRRHNQACREFDKVVIRLHALERVVTVQPYMFKRRPAKQSFNWPSRSVKPVVAQSLIGQ